MSVIAYDAAHPSLIPADPPAIFPYGDGHYRWNHDLFPKALYRYFTITGDAADDICDVEPGCVWPPTNARVWLLEREARGHRDHTVYCDRNVLPSVKMALAGLNWHLFLATLDGSQPTEYDGLICRAVQYTDRQGKYDMSIVHDVDWLNKP